MAARFRRPRGPVERLAAGLVAAAAAVAVLGVTQALLKSWVFLAAVALLTLAGAVRGPLPERTRAGRPASGLRLSLAEVDAMGDQDFGCALRDLLVRDGWTADRAGRQGGRAADVTGHHPRHGRIVLQAERTTVGAEVDVQVMHRAKGTAGPVHGADIAVVVTNGGLTRDAMAWGDQYGVHWIDRARLESWAAAGRPLHHLLPLPRRPLG
ncbi:restriction endonuclease [Kitasatospora sp. NPDC057500]|uniref:restriction endonuclease n=1 Tax=Kitasatospora sp. NPDC057500 TaxID=3346151 RepID=UPI0036921768